jgi:hypothetical protein
MQQTRIVTVPMHIRPHRASALSRKMNGVLLVDHSAIISEWPVIQELSGSELNSLVQHADQPDSIRKHDAVLVS